jgi:outer membrane protein assembly factor BamB
MDRRTFVGAAAATGATATLSAFTSPTAAGAETDKTPSAAFYAGGPSPDIPRVGLRWAFSATVFFADRIMIQSPNPRGYTSVGGGEIWGPRLQGRVLPASGADYYKGSFNTYYMFEASDGALIFIHNRGTMRRFQAPPEAGKPLVPVNAVDPNGPPVWTRFRATPMFTAPAGRHDWMNRTVFVANSQRQDHPDHTVFTYYEVL